MAVMMVLVAINLILCAYVAVHLGMIAKKVNIIFDGVDDFYKQEKNKYSDNGFNNDFIQKTLDLLMESGNEPSITVDDDGHRWISVAITKNNVVNVIRIDDRNFGVRAKWNNIEEKIKNAIEVAIPQIKESLANDDDKKKEGEK